LLLKKKGTTDTHVDGRRLLFETEQPQPPKKIIS